MSATGPPVHYEKTAGVLPKGRTALAHLLHALNQPLTGLQCSLELALVGPHNPEHYIRALRDGLELTGRMRILVEAIRELEDVEQDEVDEREVIALETLLQQTVDELVPVSEAKSIQFVMQAEKRLNVKVNRRKLATLFFRLLESALSLAAPDSALHIAGSPISNSNNGSDRGEVCIEMTWLEKTEAPEHSPFSRPELGLLIACAGWKRAGGEWEMVRTNKTQTLTLRMPLAKNN
jgi:hypothetical protein